MLTPALESQLSDFDPDDLGPHAAALFAELRRAVRAGMPLSALVLAATMVDVVAHEEAGPAGHIDGIDFAYAGNKAALGWLRGRRNAVLHHEGPSDGLMGEAAAMEREEELTQNPKISMDYFFLGDYATLKSTKAAARMTNNNLRLYLKEASISTSGSRAE